MERMYFIFDPSNGSYRMLGVYTTPKALLQDIQKYIGYFLYVIPPNVEIEDLSENDAFLIGVNFLGNAGSFWSFDDLDILPICPMAEHLTSGEHPPGNE